jgi:hypothetical protein
LQEIRSIAIRVPVMAEYTITNSQNILQEQCHLTLLYPVLLKRNKSINEQTWAADPFQKSDDAEIMYISLMKIVISSEVEDLKLQVKV